MNIPCAKRIPFIVTGLSFLIPGLTRIQFDNLCLIATALVLGGQFSLTEISRMWFKEKCVSTLSYFLSEAKFSTDEMQHLYALQVLHLYKLEGGYFLIDDTMKHHTNFCKWIHGVFVLFDHALKTNLKAICIVFLYYTDGASIKFPITFRIFYKDSKTMPWQRRKHFTHKTKYELASEMLEWALEEGFPRCLVLADAWFGIEPFIKELKRLKLSYVLEIKSSYTVKVACQKPKLTPTGRLAKKQCDKINLAEFFQSNLSVSVCGFAADKEKGKEEKVLYQTKIATVKLNAITERHRIVESTDPISHTTKYLLSDQLTWEAAKILSDYSYRWTIEEFFRNAKQLVDLEGATIRSEQGVTIALCLVSWIDFLLHFENYKQSTAEELTKESLSIPSIVRQAQYENLKVVIERSQQEEDFIEKWLKSEGEHIERKRKKHKKLIPIDKADIVESELAA